MCDPITIAGIALTAGATVANTVASGNDARARDSVLAAERIRQNSLDQEATAINDTSQARYDNFEGQQGAKASTLGDYFAAPLDEANSSAASVLPSSSSDVVNTEIAAQREKAKAYTDQQGKALGDMRSFGDLLGGSSILQARDANLVGQIGGFKNGSSAIVPMELDSANHTGDGMRTFGDILGGLGAIGTNVGLTGGGANIFGTPGATVAGVPKPATQSMFLGARRAMTPSLYPTTTVLG